MGLALILDYRGVCRRVSVRSPCCAYSNHLLGERMLHPFRNVMTCFLLMLALCLLFTCNMWAQGGTGELSGVVTDPSGAVVPDTEVTLSNTATGDKRTTTTTGAGIYRFSALPVGNYVLETS